MKTTWAFATGFTLLALSNSICSGQATVFFANSSESRITNCYTRLPQSNTIYVQLYATPDLSAVSNTAALATMVAVSTPKPLPATTSPLVHGRFHGGIITLPGVSVGQQVVAQVKAWPTNYPSFEQAVNDGAEVAESLPWVQGTGGGPAPPQIIGRWGFRAFFYPQCEPLRVPLVLERVDASTIRLDWPVGFPPTLQVNDGSSTNWQTLSSGAFVQDHWEFQVTLTNGVQFFRLAQ